MSFIRRFFSKRKGTSVRIVIEDRWTGDGTCWFWSTEEDGAIFNSGGASGMLEAARNAVNALQAKFGYPGLARLDIVEYRTGDRRWDEKRGGFG